VASLLFRYVFPQLSLFNSPPHQQPAAAVHTLFVDDNYFFADSEMAFLSSAAFLCPARNK